MNIKKFKLTLLLMGFGYSYSNTILKNNKNIVYMHVHTVSIYNSEHTNNKIFSNLKSALNYLREQNE